jgi:hypothetical protein
MKAYATPAARPATASTTTPTSTVRPLQRVAVGTAARIGLIAGGLVWVLAALVAFTFDLFGINLWLTIIEGRWVSSPGWEGLPAFMASFGGLVLSTAGVVLFGALAGALTAWFYNLTVPDPVEDFED